MRYLVTGAQGFTGRFLVAALLAAEETATVVGIGRSRESTTFTHDVTYAGRRVRAPLPNELDPPDPRRYRYEACDLRDAAALGRLFERERFDHVVHAAAALRDEPAERLIAANVGATTSLFAAIAACAVKPAVVYCSSGSVYGEAATLPVRETERAAPIEAYAMSKFAGEYVARIASAGANVSTTYARIFNIAGPGQDERHACGRFAAQIAAMASGEAPPRLEVGDLSPTRDFVDVRDVARALVRLTRSGAAGETYNVASGRETVIGTIVDTLLAEASLAGRVEVVRRYARAGDLSRQYASIAKLNALGFEPRYDLATTLRDLLVYYRDTVAQAASRSTSATSSGETAFPSSHG